MIKITQDKEASKPPVVEQRPSVKTNEPNMIVAPHVYRNPQLKGFNDIASNIISEHIAYETLTQPLRPDKVVK